MKNRITAVLWAVLMIAPLVGCGAADDTRPERMRIERYDEYRIYTDRDSGVQYLSRGESLVVIVDRDGKPLIANGWRDYGE